MKNIFETEICSVCIKNKNNNCNKKINKEKNKKKTDLDSAHN